MPPLTREQRYLIECDLRSGFLTAVIAQRLQRSKRTIEREIARCGASARYTAERATVHRQRCAAKSAANTIRDDRRCDKLNANPPKWLKSVAAARVFQKI